MSEVQKQKYDRWHPVPKELEQEVIAFYLAGNSTMACDKKFGISTSKALKCNGVKLRKVSDYPSKTRGKEQEIISDYQNGMSVPKMKEKYGVANTRLYKILDNAEIKRRSNKEYRPKSSGIEKDIIETYRTGLSAADTGKKFGVCESMVIYVLRQAGKTVRRVGVHDVTKLHNWKGGVSKDKKYMNEKRNARKNVRRSEDPLYKLTQSIRSRMTCFFKRAWVCKTNNIKKTKSTVEMLGADKETVFTHIESQFLPGMTWGNYGYWGWHVDHRIPLASAKNEQELIQLMHWSNLQPLWRADNQRKSGKIYVCKKENS